MQDVKPDVRVYVTVNDQRWEMAGTGKLTFPEAREVKRVCGMTLADLERGIAGADPDAWFAWLYVSIKRQWPTLTEAELTKAIGDTPLIAVIETAESEAPEVATDPPASAVASESPAPPPDGSFSA